MNGYMNKNIKNTFSNLRPSDECIERIMEMPKENKRKINFKPALALVAVAAIVVAGAFGGFAISAKLNPVVDTAKTTNSVPKADNFFAITAYAYDEKGEPKKVELKDDKLVKTDVRISFKKTDVATTGSDCEVHTKSDNGFIVDGENIESVSYYAKGGSFSYAKRAAENSFVVERECGDFDDSHYVPYASQLTIKPMENKVNEYLEIYYNPDEAVDVLLKTKDTDYTKLPGDEISIKVVYKDGTYGERNIKTSFDKDGYVLMKVVQ